jgi:pimeloyl-ACP methyl ester carboxylesterase
MPQPVILLHGLLMRGPALWPLARLLRRRGFDPILFDYPTLWRAPTISMEQLAMRLYPFGAGKVHVVGHSLGGLVALETLNRYQGLPPGRVACLGTPLAGSSAARGLAAKGLGLLNGRSGPLLRGGLSQLPMNREVGVIAGSHSLGLGRYFGPFDGLNDGTVAVWETRLPGLSDHLVVPISHSGLMFSRQVGEFVANFLEFGVFRP